MEQGAASDLRSLTPAGGARSALVRVAAGGGLADRFAGALEDQRHRWFLWVPVLVGCGIGAYFALNIEPGPATAAAPLAIALALCALFRSGTVGYAVSRALLAVALGLAVGKARTEWMRAPVIGATMASALVHGHVELIEPLAGRGQRLTLRVVAIDGLAPRDTPLRVRVRAAHAAPGLRPGDGVRIRARLSPPPEPVLPGGYDFARRAWFAGLGGVGFAAGGAVAAPELGPPIGLLRFGAAIERVRAAISAAVVRALPSEAGAIANALLTGERGGISPETDKAYRDSGLYHVLSISGLHMTVMAGTLFLTVRTLLAAIPSIALRLPVKKIAAVVAAHGAFGYLLISGGAFATLRSYVMISIIFLAMVVERPALALRNVALAALVMLLVWPESLLDPGFQMSFAAVTALIAVYEAWREREERLGSAGRGPRGPIMSGLVFLGGIVLSTLIAGAAVAPLAAYHFHTSQQYSVIGNVLALPICDLIVMPALLAALVAIPFGVEGVPLAIAGFGIDAMTQIAVMVGGLPGAVAAIPAIPLAALLSFMAGGLWLLLWTAPWRSAGVVPIAAGLLLAPTLDRPDLIVGRDARHVLARVDGRLLSAPTAVKTDFEFTRWLEADGDGRRVAKVAAGRGYRCDGAACTADLKGRKLSIAHHPAAAAEDCAVADILVTRQYRPRFCTRPSLVIDRRAVREGGVVSVYVTAGRIRVETVSTDRGKRPWVRQATFGRASAAAGVKPGVRPSVENAPSGDDEDFWEDGGGDVRPGGASDQ